VRGAISNDRPYRDLIERGCPLNECLSADCNDGVNPLFPQNSEDSNAAVVGYGVTIKRYGAGFDPNAEFTARIIAILDKNGFAWQTQTPKVEVGGGGTLG
jgi:aspartyl aminopeptidase